MPAFPPTPNKPTRGAPLECTKEEFRAIVMPIVEMSLFVQQVSHSTKRKQVEEHTAAVTEAKRQLAALLERRLGRPFWTDRLSNFYISTAPYLGGGADITFTETMPSKEGNIATPHRVRLQVGPETLQERFRRFVEANNPMLGNKINEFAREVITAMGI